MRHWRSVYAAFRVVQLRARSFESYARYATRYRESQLDDETRRREFEAGIVAPARHVARGTRADSAAASSIFGAPLELTTRGADPPRMKCGRVRPRRRHRLLTLSRRHHPPNVFTLRPGSILNLALIACCIVIATSPLVRLSCLEGARKYTKIFEDCQEVFSAG